MKAQIVIGIGAAAIWLTSSAFSDQYDDLVKKGYRWVTTDGSCACASKNDALRVIKNQSDDSTLRLVSKGGVYFLIRGAQAIGVTNSEVNSQLDVTATPGATATPTHGEAVEPESSPTP
jgi:hypothetical protein